MINRVELKERAKAAFKANYWHCVVVALILAAVVGASASASGRSANNASGNGGVSGTETIGEVTEIDQKAFMIIFGIIIGIVLIAILIGSLFDIFVINPLGLGCRDFFLRNTDGQPDIGVIGSGFKTNYMRNVKALFLKDFYILLWSLLLIVPGIIKAYEYAMVPYILVEDPDVTPKDALRRSSAMMDGYKKEAFVLDLSFIGWLLLDIVTLGIAGVFYVHPYMYATNAELYRFLKEQQV